MRAHRKPARNRTRRWALAQRRRVSFEAIGRGTPSSEHAGPAVRRICARRAVGTLIGHRPPPTSASTPEVSADPCWPTTLRRLRITRESSSLVAFVRVPSGESSECGKASVPGEGSLRAAAPRVHDGAGDDVLLGGGGLAEHAAVEEGGGLHDETRGGGAPRVVDALGLGRRGAAAVRDSDAGRWGGAWLRPPRHHGRRGPRGLG
eukprot:scaffold33888_cov77-Phaeocystis_antarctica.AAC.1